jgi:PAS domain S-box-containing protein
MTPNRARNSELTPAGKRTLARIEPESLYKLLVESVVDYAMFVLDPNGIILSWNAGARRIKGYEASEIIGKHFSIFYPEEDKAWDKPAWELVEATRDGRFEDEGWRIKKDGSRFWANVVITALRDPDGNLVGFAKVTRDLTERRRAEEALRESEIRFRSLVEGVTDYAIFMLTPEGNIASWNAGAERIKGYKAAEIIGKNFSVFYTPEDKAAGKPARELKTARETGRCEDEGWRVRKDGSRFWASILITALHDPKGNIRGFSKISRDLSERKEAEDRAMADTRRIAEVEASNRTKSEFLAAMSHELRTPLNAIGGYADLLRSDIAGKLTEQQKKYVERIGGSQRHLLSIINDLLNYSRIEAGKLEYHIGRVNVKQVLEAVTGMMEAPARLKGLTLDCKHIDSRFSVTGDRPKIEQIVINLVSNAVKFTPSGGRIRLDAEDCGQTIAMAVTDTGEGIQPENLDRIFEPFVQLGRSLTSGDEGAGLGLAISREMAKEMGGKLAVESEPGKGSRFTLELRSAPPE